MDVILFLLILGSSLLVLFIIHLVLSFHYYGDDIDKIEDIHGEKLRVKIIHKLFKNKLDYISPVLDIFIMGVLFWVEIILLIIYYT